MFVMLYWVSRWCLVLLRKRWTDCLLLDRCLSPMFVCLTAASGQNKINKKNNEERKKEKENQYISMYS